MKEYYCDITTVQENEWSLWYSQMDPQQQKKCDAYQRESARKQCIAADHLARAALSKHFNSFLEKVQILHAPSGKPYVAGNSVYFSISHSDHLVACVLSSNPVGIDIEYLHPVPHNVQERICTDEELRFLKDAKNDEDRLMRFFYLWTRKEAVFKIDGDLPRRDRETNVLFPDAELAVETRVENGCVISIAKREKSSILS
ncbi:MAG: 4'-phosphopantetheinyl transferase superfamily protein [Clostridia bacterium]|nr:4'-phosphopantetheinyl transferase superfamily protein [Clostridia bacterium]